MLSLGVHAQDTHYWTQQFGTRSALMSGAVIGGANDNTMIFYNPGALGFLESTSVSVNANAYRIESIRIENALGNRARFESDQLGSVPLLAGGMINLNNERLKLGYGFMAPVDFNFKGIARVDNIVNIVDDEESPGDEEIVGETSVTSKVKELLIALGGGYRINDHWSVGLTNMFTVRSHTYNRGFSAYAFVNAPDLAFIGGNLAQNVDYYNVRYAAKLGVVYKKDHWSAGLTVTSPSVNFFGQGTTASNIAARNILFDGQDERLSGVATDRQAELKTKFKSPLSVAAGINYKGQRSGFGIAVEYFAGIDIYNIMEPVSGSFVRPVDLAPELGSDLFLRTSAGAESVVNVALGYEHFVNDRVTLYLSTRSDLSYFKNELNDLGGIKTSLSSWDIYHLTGGITLTGSNTQLSMGILASAGRDGSYEQQGNLSNPGETDLLNGALIITEARYTSLGFLFGFTYFFNRLGMGKSSTQ